MLTDPAIHSMTPGCYGFTDHGPSGVKRFFKTHKCGNTCIQMGLNNCLPWQTVECVYDLHNTVLYGAIISDIEVVYFKLYSYLHEILLIVFVLRNAEGNKKQFCISQATETFSIGPFCWMVTNWM